VNNRLFGYTSRQIENDVATVMRKEGHVDLSLAARKAWAMDHVTRCCPWARLGIALDEDDMNKIGKTFGEKLAAAIKEGYGPSDD